MTTNKKIRIIVLLIATLIVSTHDVSAEEKDGWVLSGEDKYYYINEEKLTGKQELDRQKYYFDETGKMYKEFKTEDGKIYYYSLGAG